MTDHAERETVRGMMGVGHTYACASVKFIRPNRMTGLDDYGKSGKPCDCGADARRDAALNALVAAVLASARARVEALPNAKRDGVIYGGTFEMAEVLAALTPTPEAI